MKTAFLFFAFAFVALSTFGQVSGKLTTANGEPLPFVNVLLLNAADSALVKGIMSTALGEYRIENVPGGTYMLRITAIGYKSYHSPSFSLTTPNATKVFETLVLEEDAQQLAEIVVQGEKPLYQQEIDRTVINVENSVLTKGSSALQVLERSPGVFVDMRNNSIALNGKSSVMIMLNGKLVRLPAAQVVAMLNGMSANNIEKIELLTTPTSKYDADGSAGMINIVLKKREEIGTTGSFSATTGYGWKEKGAASVNLSHNTGKVNLYGSYAFLHNRQRDGWVAQSTQNMPAFGGELSVDVSSMQNQNANSHNATLGLDVNATSNTTFGGSVTYNSSRIAREVFNRGNYTIVASDSLLVMRADIAGNSRWRNTIASVFLEHRWREGESLNIDVDYLGYDIENPTDVNTVFFDREGNEATPSGSIFSNRQRGVSSSPIHVGVAKVDYAKQFSKGVRFEGGLKGTFTRSTSTSSIETLENNEWVSSPRYLNDTDMREWIAAGYASMNVQLNASTSLMAGARYEYSHTFANADKDENKIDRRLGKLFPSVFLSKKLGEQSELQFSYTKRISRPSFNDLASFLFYTDPMSVATGNPALQPTVTNNFKIGYNHHGYSFSLTASRDDHPIVLYQEKESPARDLMYNRPENMAYQNNLTFQATLPFTVAKWWTMTYSYVGGLRQFKLDHTQEKLVKTYFAYSFNGSQTFSLPKNFSLELSGWYNSTQYDGSKKLDGFGMLNAGIKKDLNKNWGSLQLSVTDIFKSMRVSGYFGTITEEAFSLKAHFVYGAESANNRIVRLTYSKSFGNVKVKSKSSRDGTSKDERDRIRRN
ncbi:outer membrane beta-barrel family protein [Chryseolinea lacunae]|uniref:TonB-dependent receptor n=1 Tax=Chryseolinea lacunae TaxID=2801331 RepID=A0ABS1KRV8_9BACT|nr:outer membrane beta-barrel family protein [Chryseolinea lacunae]MBL0741957.1 TonB-dependent receptor [Chryseolinea lacunae]